jgi:hypothetical protein
MGGKMGILLPILICVLLIGYGVYCIITEKATIRMRGWSGNETIRMEGMSARLIGGLYVTLGLVIIGVILLAR